MLGDIPEDDDGRKPFGYKTSKPEIQTSSRYRAKPKNWDKPWEKNPYTQDAEEVDMGSKKPTIAEMKAIIEKKYY